MNRNTLPSVHCLVATICFFPDSELSGRYYELICCWVHKRFMDNSQKHHPYSIPKTCVGLPIPQNQPSLTSVHFFGDYTFRNKGNKKLLLWQGEWKLHAKRKLLVGRQKLWIQKQPQVYSRKAKPWPRLMRHLSSRVERVEVSVWCLNST